VFKQVLGLFFIKTISITAVPRLQAEYRFSCPFFRCRQAVLVDENEPYPKTDLIKNIVFWPIELYRKIRINFTELGLVVY